jgi:hypothetical protein
MANCLFSYPDRTLSATPAHGGSISGGSWLSALSLSNLQNRLRSKVARSTNAANASTVINIDLGAAKPVRLIAILNHNASMNATVRVSLSALSAAGSELGQYTGLQFWPGYYPPSTPLEWEESEYWGGMLNDADAADYNPSPDFWHVLSQSVNARYIKVEIFDSANPAGYFQLGRLWVGPGLQPEVNLDYGYGMVWKQDVLKAKSLGGVDWFTVLSAGREISGTLANLSYDEGMVMVFDRQRRLGLEGELFFVMDPDDTVLLFKQRAMLCRHADENPLLHPFFNRSSGSFQLVEVR